MPEAPVCPKAREVYITTQSNRLTHPHTFPQFVASKMHILSVALSLFSSSNTIFGFEFLVFFAVMGDVRAFFREVTRSILVANVEEQQNTKTNWNALCWSLVPTEEPIPPSITYSLTSLQLSIFDFFGFRRAEGNDAIQVKSTELHDANEMREKTRGEGRSPFSLSLPFLMLHCGGSFFVEFWCFFFILCVAACTVDRNLKYPFSREPRRTEDTRTTNRDCLKRFHLFVRSPSSAEPPICAKNFLSLVLALPHPSLSRKFQNLKKKESCLRYLRFVLRMSRIRISRFGEWFRRRGEITQAKAPREEARRFLRALKHREREKDMFSLLELPRIVWGFSLAPCSLHVWRRIVRNFLSFSQQKGKQTCVSRVVHTLLAGHQQLKGKKSCRRRKKNG